MGESRPPLRAAFWAICAALLLMLLATLSDPYRVRQSMLAQRGLDRSRSATPVERSHLDLPEHSDRLPTAPLTPATNRAESLESPLVAGHAAVPAPSADDTIQDDHVTGGAQTHVISAGEGGTRRPLSRPSGRPAMPILAPGELTGPTTGGRFEELPPPPELDSDREIVVDMFAAAGGAADLSHEAERALERLQLETELLTLRHDLNRSIASRQIEQIQHLQQQQSTLLDRQQQTAERLEQLADQLAAQSARIDRFFEHQAQAAPPQTAGGRHRLSLVIESDDMVGILERLGRWATATALEQTTPPVTRSAFVEPQPRYLAPPPAHSDPTPLSELESLPEEVVAPALATPTPGRAPGGPLFAPPALCR